MQGRKKGTSDAGSTEQVIQILQQVRALRERGAPVDERRIVARHPRIETRLKRGFEHLRRIEAAAEAAAIQPATTLDVAQDEEPRLLAECLPAYKLGERVQFGGQGVVYRAVERATGRHVAVKLLLHGRLATQREQHRFEREVEILSRLQHPNIVSVYDSGCVDRRHYVVMQFIDGVSIDTFVVSDDLTIRGTVELFIKVCRAIEYAHQRGVIHRDIKPDNIIVNAKGVPFVLDFGLAKDTAASAGPMTTVAGHRVGTLAYFSPEQASERDSDVDVRSDVYSLGVTLFVLIAQAFPYQVGQSPWEMRRIVLEQESLSLRAAITEGRPGRDELNDDLERIVRKALAKEKERRYSSVGGLAEDLERYLCGEAVLAKADSALYVLRKTVRRYRLLVGAAAFLCLTFGASTLMVWNAQRETARQRDRAREAARLAHGLFADSMTVIEDGLSTLAGGLPLREEFTANLSETLPRFLQLVEPDAAMHDIEWAVREKQGDLASELGRYDEARSHYEAVIDGSAVGSLSRARSHRKLGQTASDYDADFRQAIQAAKALAVVPTDSLLAVVELCEARLGYGRRLLDSERMADAMSQIGAAVEVLESATVPRADSAEAVRLDSLLAAAYSMRAAHLKMSGEQQAAVADSRKALEIRRSLSQRHPANVEFKHELLVSLMRLADHSPDDTEAILEEGSQVGRYLFDVEPRAEWLVDIFGVFDRAAFFALQLNRYAAAKDHADRSLDVAERIAASQPHGPAAQRALGHAYETYGWIEHGQARWSEAVALLNTAAQHWERTLLLSSEVGDVAAAAANYDLLGYCLLRLGRATEALKANERALALRKSSYGARTDRIAVLAMSRSLINLAGGHAFADLPTGSERAAPLLAEAEQLLDQIADETDPEVAERRRAIQRIRQQADQSADGGSQ